MKIILGSDKSGFYLKEAVKDFLNANGYDVIETGTVTPDKGIPFYEVAPQACSCIQKEMLIWEFLSAAPVWECLR